MVTQRERHNPVRLFLRRLMMVGLFLLVCLVASGVWNIFWKNQESIALNQQAQARLADLRERQSELTANIQGLDSEHGREAVLRQQYALGHPGEGMIVIVDPPIPIAVVSTTTAFQSWIKRVFLWW